MAHGAAGLLGGPDRRRQTRGQGVGKQPGCCARLQAVARHSCGPHECWGGQCGQNASQSEGPGCGSLRLLSLGAETAAGASSDGGSAAAAMPGPMCMPLPPLRRRFRQRGAQHASEQCRKSGSRFNVMLTCSWRHAHCSVQSAHPQRYSMSARKGAATWRRRPKTAAQASVALTHARQADVSLGAPPQHALAKLHQQAQSCGRQAALAPPPQPRLPPGALARRRGGVQRSPRRSKGSPLSIKCARTARQPVGTPEFACGALQSSPARVHLQPPAAQLAAVRRSDHPRRHAQRRSAPQTQVQRVGFPPRPSKARCGWARPLPPPAARSSAARACRSA